MNARWRLAAQGLLGCLLLGLGFLLGRVTAPHQDTTAVYEPPTTLAEAALEPPAEPALLPADVPVPPPEEMNEADAESDNAPSAGDNTVPDGRTPKKRHQAKAKIKVGEPPIDPNTATEEELCRLPGVGPSMAGRILQDRKDSGPFQVKEDLLRVRGIGTKKLSVMAPFLALPSAREVPAAP